MNRDDLASADGRSHHLLAGAHLQDNGSQVVVAGTVRLGILRCVQLPRAVPAPTSTSASGFVC